jgi:hypothetical protein
VAWIRFLELMRINSSSRLRRGRAALPIAGLAPAAWWLAPAPAAPTGLTQAEAQAELARCGANSLDVHRRRSLALQFLARFRNPLVLILLAAGAISALTGEVANFLIIMAMVVLSVMLDFVQELLLPFTPLAALFRFEPPPGVFYAWLAAMVLSYLIAVEGANQFFYARLAGQARQRGPSPPGP